MKYKKLLIFLMAASLVTNSGSYTVFASPADAAESVFESMAAETDLSEEESPEETSEDSSESSDSSSEGNPDSSDISNPENPAGEESGNTGDEESSGGENPGESGSSGDSGESGTESGGDTGSGGEDPSQSEQTIFADIKKGNLTDPDNSDDSNITENPDGENQGTSLINTLDPDDIHPLEKDPADLEETTPEQVEALQEEEHDLTPIWHEEWQGRGSEFELHPFRLIFPVYARTEKQVFIYDRESENESYAVAKVEEGAYIRLIDGAIDAVETYIAPENIPVPEENAEEAGDASSKTDAGEAAGAAENTDAAGGEGASGASGSENGAGASGAEGGAGSTKELSAEEMEDAGDDGTIAENGSVAESGNDAEAAAEGGSAEDTQDAQAAEGESAERTEDAQAAGGESAENAEDAQAADGDEAEAAGTLEEASSEAKAAETEEQAAPEEPEEEKEPVWVYVEAKDANGEVARGYMNANHLRSVKSYDNDRSKVEVIKGRDSNGAFYDNYMTTYRSLVDENPISPERIELVNYALQFLGNPYVWGGESLTDGCDCSGFAGGVYRHFGYDLPRCSYEICYVSEPMNPYEAQPGDLLFFAGAERVNHVMICLSNEGDGTLLVVEAKGEKWGIVVSRVSCERVVWSISLLDQKPQDKSEELTGKDHVLLKAKTVVM